MRKRVFSIIILSLFSSFFCGFSSFFDYAKPELVIGIGIDDNRLKSSNYNGWSSNFSFATELNPARFRFSKAEEGLYLSLPFSIRFNSISKLSLRRYVDESWDYILSLRAEYCFNPKIIALFSLGYGVEYYPFQNAGCAVLRTDLGVKYRVAKNIVVLLKEGVEKSTNKLTFATDVSLSVSP